MKRGAASGGSREGGERNDEGEQMSLEGEGGGKRRKGYGTLHEKKQLQTVGLSLFLSYLNEAMVVLVSCPGSEQQIKHLKSE